MGKIRNLRDFYRNNTNLADKTYLYVVFFSSFSTLITSLVTLLEGSGIVACVAVFFSFIVMCIVGFFSIYYSKIKLGKTIYAYLFGCIILPFIYLTCGGIDSGSPIYMITSFFLIAVLLDGKEGIICLIINTIIEIGVLWIPFFNPATIYTSKPLTVRGRYFDNSIALGLAGIAIFFITYMSLNAYRKEKKYNEELLTKLKDMSVKDELTGLYNRRHLYGFLDELYKKETSYVGDYFIAMFDLDNFKQINDNYGHLFGDDVLTCFSNLLHANVLESHNELACRYGGEEFMLIIKAKTFKLAFAKIDGIRKSLESKDWANCNFNTTVSVGLVACNKFNDMNSCLKRVDDLLYKAKESGKNKVVYEI